MQVKVASHRHLAALALLACSGNTLLGADDFAAREARIAGMPTAEQQELLRRHERFNALPSEERERLRNLQAAIDADPHPERLQRVLTQYHEWLKTLTPAQREELADLPPKERVEQIKRIQKRQQAAREQAHRAELLSRQDMREIARWTEELVWRHREDLLNGMSKSQLKSFEKNDPQRQRRALLYRAISSDRSRRNRGALAWIDQPDIDRLVKKLSEPAKKELAAAPDLSAQRKVLGGWIGTSLHGLEPWQHMRRPGPLVGEELLQFLQNDVPQQQRERLLKMPREQMLEELRTMYFDRGRVEFGPPGGPGGPWRDGGPPDRGKGDPRGKRNRPQPPADSPPKGESKSEVPAPPAPEPGPDKLAPGENAPPKP